MLAKLAIACLITCFSLSNVDAAATNSAATHQWIDNDAPTIDYSNNTNTFRPPNAGEVQPASTQMISLPPASAKDAGVLNSVLADAASSDYDSLYVWGHWNGRTTYGGSWGYVDSATGNEYALICSRPQGVSIIQIDNWPPTEVGFMPTLFGNTDAKDVKTYRHWAIIVKENEPLQIFDIANVANPVQVATITPIGGGSHNCWVEGNYLYVVGNHGIGGLEIWNITNPANPGARVGQYNTYYYHDIDIRNDTLYAAAIYGQGIDVLNIANKANPVFITNFNYPGSGAHNIEISPDGHYVFVGDEIGTSGQWTRVFDISDINNVQLVSQIVVHPNASVHNCFYKDGYLYIAHYTEGVRIWDVTNPASPFEVARNDTYPGGGFGYSGVWDVTPYFPSGKITASDMQTGLYVFEWGNFVCPDVVDSDGDGFKNACDNCSAVANSQQYDENSDGVGDACDGFLHIESYEPDTAYLNVPYNYQFWTVGGTPPYNWSFVGGDTPIGCDFNNGIGTVTGDPSFIATYYFTVAVSDGSTPTRVDTLSTRIIVAAAPPPPFMCGDADGNDVITISDAVYMINYIFAGGPAPSPILSADADCNAIVTISDAVYLINYIFVGGPAPCSGC